MPAGVSIIYLYRVTLQYMSIVIKGVFWVRGGEGAITRCIFLFPGIRAYNKGGIEKGFEEKHVNTNGWRQYKTAERATAVERT